MNSDLMRQLEGVSREFLIQCAFYANTELLLESSPQGEVPAAIFGELAEVRQRLADFWGLFAGAEEALIVVMGYVERLIAEGAVTDRTAEVARGSMPCAQFAA